MQKENIGATRDEWVHFSVILGLASDLLPVVSNRDAVIDPESTMKEVGKTPSRYNGSRKAVGVAKWTQYRATNADVRKWAAEPDYGICLQSREVRALDIDVSDPALAGKIRDFILSHHNLPERFRSNASKHLFAFKLEGDFTKRKFKTESGVVEFLANGQQFIAAGTHTSGVRYEWRGGLPDEIPSLSAEQFEAIWAALVERFALPDTATEQSATTKHAKLADAVHNDPVAQQLIDLGIVSRVERDGRLHFTCPWEADHTTNSSESATTYWPAHTGGYALGHFHCMHSHCEARTDDEFKTALDIADADLMADFDDLTKQDSEKVPYEAENGDPVDVGTENKPMRFQPIQADVFAQLEAEEWIIKGVLPQAELGVMFGESGSGKTFKVLSMAMAVATGEEWHGRSVKQGAVAYIAAEGAGGCKKRIRAYAQHYGLDLKSVPIYVIPAAPNLLEKKDALDVAKAILSLKVRVSLVIIDTLAQTTAGGNENSGEDMGLALSHCKGVHRATGAMMLLVHHSGKDTSKGARGWSGLRGACDAELEVLRFDQERVLSVSKQKDGVDSLEFGFKLNIVTLGFDEDGEEITSCVAEPVEGVVRQAKSGKKVGHNERLVLRTMGEMMAGEGEGAQVGALIERVTAQMLPPDEGKKDRRREMCHRAIQALQDAEKVAVNDRGELFIVGDE